MKCQVLLNKEAILTARKKALGLTGSVTALGELKK